MVLAELGGKLRESLRKIRDNSNNVVDEAQLNALLADIARALIESDVNVKLVMQLRNNIKAKVEASRMNKETSSSSSSTTSQWCFTIHLDTVISP